jgi:Xaa-Pro aminopeptidase
MRVTQPAVLVGNYDWDEQLIPRAEYDARIRHVLAKLDHGLAGLVVYGNKVDNAALAYLTNFAPKIESAVALMGKDGKIRIHAAGSPQMMVNAKRLTWVEDVRPQRDVPKHIADWAAEAAAPGPLGFWTTEAMPGDLLPRLEAGLGARKLVDVSATLNPLLREKSPVALKLTRAACAMLGKAAATLKAGSRGGSARAAAVAAETTAAHAGAQDMRVLISLSDGGTPTAIDYPEGGKHDPLLAYIAVRHAGYWA